MNNKNIAIFGIIAYIISLLFVRLGSLGEKFLPIVFFLLGATIILFIVFLILKKPSLFILMFLVLFMLVFFIYWNNQSVELMEYLLLADYLGSEIRSILYSIEPIITIIFIVLAIGQLKERTKLPIILFIISSILLIIFMEKFTYISLLFHLITGSQIFSYIEHIRLSYPVIFSIINFFYFMMYFWIVTILLGVKKEKKVLKLNK